MYCKKCGSKIPEGGKYCEQCGYNKPAVVEENNETVNQQYQNNNIRFCKQCGAELLSNAKFCEKCGTGTGVKQITENNNELPEQQYENECTDIVIGNDIIAPKDDHKKKLLIMIISGSVFLIIAAAAIVFLILYNNDKGANKRTLANSDSSSSIETEPTKAVTEIKTTVSITETKISTTKVTTTIAVTEKETKKTEKSEKTETKSENSDDNKYKAGTVKLDEGYLNVRETPDKKGDIVGKLYNGDKVSVMDEEDGWYKIKFEDDKAYVYKDFVVLESKKNSENENEKKDDGSWQNAYADFLTNGKYASYTGSDYLGTSINDGAKFNIYDIDKDKVPELLMAFSDAHVSSVVIFYYDGKEVKPIKYDDNDFIGVGSYGSINVNEKKPVIWSRFTGQGTEFNKFYEEIDKGKYSSIDEFKITDFDIPDKSKYYVNGNECTKEKFDSTYLTYTTNIKTIGYSESSDIPMQPVTKESIKQLLDV